MADHAAVVVGVVDYGEADRVVRLLTPDLGRLAVMARGARASRRRYGGALDLGTRLRASLSARRGGMPLLTSVDDVRAPNRARADLWRIALLAYGCELCAALAPEHHEAERLFRLLETWLDLLESRPDVGSPSRAALEGKALTFAGITPTLLVCPRCAAPLAGRVVFDAEAGGGVHAGCGGGREVGADALARLDALRRTPLAETVGLAELPGASRWLLSDFARHHLGHDLRSRAALQELEADGPASG